jgi:Tfp pilus assembly PilM family ATPase
MSKNIHTSIGIEFNPTSLRAAWVQGTPDHLEFKGSRELMGDFTKKKLFVEALKDLKGVMGFSSSEPVATAISGKQVHVVQMPFKKLPESEMKNALRFEIRQNLPFDAMGASLGYQWIGTDQLMVAVVAGNYFKHQVECYTEASMNVQILDVLPLCLSNGMWARKMEMEPGLAQVCLHFGEENCTLVVDGDGVPFYSRTILFRVNRLFAQNGDVAQDVEVENALALFGEELRRSLNFYEKNNDTKGFSRMVLSGKFCNELRLQQALRKDVGLTMESQSVKTILHGTENLPDFEYDVALTLAMRGVGK